MRRLVRPQAVRRPAFHFNSQSEMREIAWERGNRRYSYLIRLDDRALDLVARHPEIEKSEEVRLVRALIGFGGALQNGTDAHERIVPAYRETDLISGNDVRREYWDNGMRQDTGPYDDGAAIQTFNPVTMFRTGLEHYRGDLAQNPRPGAPAKKAFDILTHRLVEAEYREGGQYANPSDSEPYRQFFDANTGVMTGGEFVLGDLLLLQDRPRSEQFRAATAEEVHALNIRKKLIAAPSPFVPA